MSPVEELVPTEMGRSEPVLEGGTAHCPECGCPMLPSAIQGATGPEIRLRCFARRIGKDRYVAECIDLDLAAEADTLEGAVSGLSDAMRGYLMVVLDGVETDQAIPTDILRPAPLSHRVRFYLEYLKYRILARSEKKFYRAPLGFGYHCNA